MSHKFLLQLFSIALVCNALTWTWDGDYEALLNGHEIHQQQHQSHHGVEVTQLVGQDGDQDDDHHCSFSAHILEGLLSEQVVKIAAASSTKLDNSAVFFLSQTLAPPRRPPIYFS